MYLVPGIDGRSRVDRAHLILLRPAHAHVHHLMGLPEVLMDLLVEHGVPYDWTVHDYYTICPRVNLIGAGGKYCGEPDAGSCNRCLASLGDDQGRPVIGDDHRLARAVWPPSGRCAAGLRPQRGCSPAAGAIFRRPAGTVRPHAEALPSLESLAAPPVLGETIRVAVLGTIVPVKGVEVLEACARDARRRKLPTGVPRDRLDRPQRGVRPSGERPWSRAAIGRRRSSSCWRPSAVIWLSCRRRGPNPTCTPCRP